MAAVALTLGACSRSPEPSVERLAFLPFENLTGDASLDWVSTAAPAIMAAEIQGLPNVLPTLVPNVSEAYRVQATRFVHGYFTKPITKQGIALRFNIEVEDALHHKMVKTTAVDGQMLSAINAMAKDLEPAAHPFSSSNSDAVAAWGRGEYERATTLDPDFGAAWMSWVEALSQRNPAQAIEVAGRALERPSLRSPIDRAQIELASATLRKDVSRRLNALATLVHLEPANTPLIEALAEAELSARDFTKAAEQYRSLLKLDPGNPVALNLLGYAEAYQGNLAVAQKIFEEYGRQPGQAANSLDSRGEAFFINGRFADAEKYFLQANQANSALLGEEDLLKATYARWLSGDLKGADAIAKRYFDFREKARDPILVWREAVWQYATGRLDQAIDTLESAPPSQRELVEKQMAVWRGTVKPPSDLPVLKDLYERSLPSTDGEARIFYSAALFAAGQKDEARKLLTLWPLPDSGGDPLFQSLVYPKFLELRREAGLT